MRYQILCGREIATKDRFATQMANYCYLAGALLVDPNHRCPKFPLVGCLIEGFVYPFNRYMMIDGIPAPGPSIFIQTGDVLSCQLGQNRNGEAKRREMPSLTTIFIKCIQIYPNSTYMCHGQTLDDVNLFPVLGGGGHSSIGLYIPSIRIPTMVMDQNFRPGDRWIGHLGCSPFGSTCCFEVGQDH